MFKLEAEFNPAGDQPEAIEALYEGVRAGEKSQVLLGVTGSGKTYTIAHLVQKVQRPTLVIAHNKTLAAQLYQELKAFFPTNAVEYFVSYYDYYQPEAYIARTDTYIEKDFAINEEIERMRLSATRSLLERSDVIIVASVSCIYGLGLPEYYSQMQLKLKCGQRIRRDDLLLHLVQMRYTRSDFELRRGIFRPRGEVLEVMPAYEESIAFRIECLGDEVERLSTIDPLTGRVIERIDSLVIYPGSHYVTPEEVRFHAVRTIRDELMERAELFEKESKLIEKQRILERTLYDLEMIRSVGFCKGIENYSRHFSKRKAGDPPPCLIDYFPRDFLLVIDESHQTLPQLHAMFNGDRARKQSLVDFGFRLPSAFDNRPLKFEEFCTHIHQVVYVSATPSEWEVREAQGKVVQQIIRPTGLLDPKVEVRPATNQVDDCIEEIRKEVEGGGRVLVTTLTKKLSEDLSNYLLEVGVQAKYLHSDIDTLERVQIINDLREGVFDVLVGINLLREGLDIPEVSLVAILDADKEGFLRSETALLQTCGRAARNSRGRVVLYADKRTKAIERTITISEERRKLQEAHNTKHGITPQTIKKRTPQDLIRTFDELEGEQQPKKGHYSHEEIAKRIRSYEQEMVRAAKEMRFEEAARLRDLIKSYKRLELLEEM